MSKILSIDFGEKNIGLATADSEAGIVFGKGIIKSGGSLLKIFDAILEVCKSEDVKKIVFGVPEAVEGESGQAYRIKSIGRKLEEHLRENGLPIEVVFEDESFSSYEAREKQREYEEDLANKYSEHEIAAMIILENYLSHSK